ncbi:MAG: helix-turn-helix transcriptional regulator [Euryarchaeota archaeon]|nr:helix-turn-helix transcriptional regulator [Euryarchaeota archaeon]
MAIHVLGSELKLITMHGLMARHRRFNELRELTGLCQSSLARTLRDLEELGLAERVVHPDERPVAVEYRLTPMGQDLSLAIEAFERWTERWMAELEARLGKQLA